MAGGEQKQVGGSQSHQKKSEQPKIFFQNASMAGQVNTINQMRNRSQSDFDMHMPPEVNSAKEPQKMRKFDMSEISAPTHLEANKTIPLKSNQSQQSTYISKSPLLSSNGKGKAVGNHAFNPMFKNKFFFSPVMTAPYSPSFKQMSSASKIAGANSSKFVMQGQQQN